MLNESELTQICLNYLRADPNLVVLKHWDRGVGFPDTSVTGYGRTTWIEFKAPPEGRNIFEYVSHSMNQLHTMCRLDRPAGLAHYVIWDDERYMSIWRPKQLMFRVRQNQTWQQKIPYVTVSFEKPTRREMIQLLYSPECVGPLRFKTRGQQVLKALVTGGD